MSDREKFLAALNDEDIRGKREKILLNVGPDKHRLEAERFEAALDEESLDFDKVENDLDVYNELMKLTGLQRKDVLRNCFRSIGLRVENGELNKLDKVTSIRLFFSVFDVYPKVYDGDDVDEEGPDLEKISSADDVSQSPDQLNDDNCAISIEQMQIIFDRSTVQERKDIQAADERIIYKNMPVTLKDEFEIQITSGAEIQLYDGVAAIADKHGRIVAVGKIEHAIDGDGQSTSYLTFEAEKIRYEEFRNQERFNIILAPLSEKKTLCKRMTAERAAACQVKLYMLCGYSFKYKELEKTNRTLCIDFGTSNTTAGTYGIIGDNDNDINLVTFIDVTEDKFVKRDMLPTMVYIDSCLPNEEVVYKFGYEAKKELIRADYDTEASIFYELKRWINSMDESEEIHDQEGNKTHVKHKDIIQKYLEHVIRQAEQQFKVQFTKLHFTAPVKLKENFLNKVREMFPDHKIMDSSESLDEGMAIVYNHISNRMKTKTADEYSEKILILDCGGGTTDLANCNYSYRDTKAGKVLKIKTFFENGESNYGGNNITYRILQMLKIKIMLHLLGENIKMQDLIKEDETAMLKLIDNSFSNKSQIYEAFENKYAEAEKYIPTRFAEIKMKEDKRMIKRNFYYLWQMAEAIKIQFYKENTNIVNVNFNRDEDRKIYVVSDKQYYLYVRDDGQGPLKERRAPLNEIEITFKDIERIIEPDIYALLNTMLRLYDNKGNIYERLNELQKYFYRLSGQSCKVTLFPELLKEFIPGKILRRGKNSGVVNRMSDDLKKYCIEGSIEYMRDRERGFISPDIEKVKPSLIYDIKAEGRSEYNLSRSGEINVLTLPMTASETTFVVYDSQGEIKNNVRYEFKMKGSRIAFDELKERIKTNTYFSSEQLQGLYDKLGDIEPTSKDYGESKLVFCLFVLPSQEGYGMRIFQVSIINKGEGTYYSMPKEEPKFASYENEQLLTFFDGLR